MSRGHHLRGESKENLKNQMPFCDPNVPRFCEMTLNGFNILTFAPYCHEYNFDTPHFSYINFKGSLTL